MAVAPTYVGSSAHGALNQVPGSERNFAVTGTVGASDTYATGGFAITPATLGLSKILNMNGVVFSTGHTGFWTGTNLKVFVSGGTEVTNTSTDLQSATFLLTGQGR